MKAAKSYELSVSERECKIVYECLCHCFEIAAQALSNPHDNVPFLDNHDDYEALASMIDSMRKHLQ